MNQWLTYIRFSQDMVLQFEHVPLKTSGTDNVKKGVFKRWLGHEVSSLMDGLTL
jgi:hypothetical protein